MDNVKYEAISVISATLEEWQEIVNLAEPWPDNFDNEEEYNSALEAWSDFADAVRKK